MIRINLLSEGRRPVVARRTRPKISLGDQDPSVYLLAGGLILGLLIAGGQWWRLQSQLDGVNDKVRAAQREVDELRPILEEVEDFKAKEAELKRKIQVINDLTLAQQGPVHIMDEVSKALPDLLWLRRMNVRGTTVDLSGTAFNTNAIAAFIENLDKVPEFKEPVPRAMNAARGGTFDFDISFNFVQQKPEPEPEEEPEEEV
jgi:type IV pilus assembly protein PilN